MNFQGSYEAMSGETKTVTMGLVVTVPVNLTVEVGENPEDDEITKVELSSSATVPLAVVYEWFTPADFDHLAKLVRK